MSTNSVYTINNIFKTYQNGPAVYEVMPQIITNMENKEVIHYCVGTNRLNWFILSSPGQPVVQIVKQKFIEDIYGEIEINVCWFFNLETGFTGAYCSPLDPNFHFINYNSVFPNFPSSVGQEYRRSYVEYLGQMFQIICSYFNDTNTPSFLYFVTQLVDPTYCPPLSPLPPVSTNNISVPKHRISPFFLSLPPVKGYSVTNLSSVKLLTITNYPGQDGEGKIWQFSIDTTLVPGNNWYNLHGSRATLKEGHWNISVCRRGKVYYQTNDINLLYTLNLEDGSLQYYQNGFGTYCAFGDVESERASTNYTFHLNKMLSLLGAFKKANSNSVVASNFIWGLIQKETVTNLPVLKIEKTPTNWIKITVTGTKERADYLLESTREDLRDFLGGATIFNPGWGDHSNHWYYHGYVRSDGSPIVFLVPVEWPMQLFRVKRID